MVTMTKAHTEIEIIRREIVKYNYQSVYASCRVVMIIHFKLSSFALSSKTLKFCTIYFVQFYQLFKIAEEISSAEQRFK